MNFSGAIGALGGMVKAITGTGLTLIPLFLVVDIIAPGTTNIVDGLANLVNSFTGEGLTGLIILIVVLAIAD